jgi:predicted Fe-Mo cluster-binding NifX family protein
LKIAVSARENNLDALVDPRFGRCRYFILADPETMSFETCPNPGADAAGGAGIKAAQFVVSKKADAVIAGEVGPHALQALEAGRVKVYTVSSGTVREVLDNYKNGKL